MHPTVLETSTFHRPNYLPTVLCRCIVAHRLRNACIINQRMASHRISMMTAANTHCSVFLIAQNVAKHSRDPAT
jgi:hypothetical protein